MYHPKLSDKCLAYLMEFCLSFVVANFNIASLPKYSYIAYIFQHISAAPTIEEKENSMVKS